MTVFTDKTLTAANSVGLWRAKGYNDNFARLEGYAADNAFTFGDATIGETVMGVDGIQSGAYLPHEIDFSIHLQANSPSRDHFDKVFGKIRANQETMAFEFQFDIPAVKKRYTAKGFPVTIPGGTSAKQALESGTYNFKLGEINVEDIA